MPPKTYFEELSYALRRRELLPRPLEEDGLLPVEWNGRILCRVTESGAVRYDPTWVNNGHYYMEDYQGAREDFALRSGLVARERVFDREQLEGLRQAVQGFLYGEGPPPTSRSSNAGASWIRSQPSCRKEPRIRCRAKVRSLDSPYEGGAKSGAAFSIQKLLVSLGLRHFFRYVW